MNKSNIRHYTKVALWLLVGVLGISIVTRAQLGCVASMCAPYVLSRLHGQSLTFGMLVFVMYLLFLAIECILLRKVEVSTIARRLAYSLFTCLMLDIAMWLTQWLEWSDTIGGFSIRILQLTLGTSVLGLSRMMLYNNNEALPSDNLSDAFAQMLGVEQRKARICCDIILAIIGVIFCVFYFGEMRWYLVGAGTLVSCSGVWVMVVYMPESYSWLGNICRNSDSSVGDNLPNESFQSQDSLPLVITIARTHGSGGHLIGEKVAERLGVNFYDKVIIGDKADQLERLSEKNKETDPTRSLRHLGRDSAMFNAQSHVILECAKESCVIVGRCADYVLRNRPFCLNIFVRCDEDYAVTLIRNKDNFSGSRAREVIRIKNNARERHYSHFTSWKWRDPSHYDLVINTAKIGIDSAVDIICNAVLNITKVE